MVKFVATAGVNMNALVGLAQAANPDQLDFPATSRFGESFVALSGSIKFVVNGSGFTYPPPFSPFGGPITGTVKTIFVSKSDAPQYQLSNFGNLPVADLGDIAQLATFLKGNDTLTGGASVDVLKGFNGNDTIKGNGQNDNLDGGAGNDKLFGGAGDDKMTGGAGADTMSGGPGNDTYFFKAGFGKDTITDFAAGPGVGDKMSVKGLFANFNAVKAAASVDINGDLVITHTPSNKITLTNLDAVSDLHSNDFLFT